MKNKWTQYFLILLREWGLFILFITFFLLTRLFLWLPVQVDGHSMDPTLANNQRVIVLKHTSIERFDIVVAKEVENGKTKQIVKRIIGMPGDTITYQNDKLTVNGKEESRKNTSKNSRLPLPKISYKKNMHTAITSNNWLKNLRPSLSTRTKTLPSLSLFLKANISYLEITVSFQKIAAKLVTLTRVLL